MRSLSRAAALLVAVLASTAASAHPDYGYDRPPPPPDDYYEAPPSRRPPPPRGRPLGYNCDAVQQTITGPKPYSCPLPGPRPLGARCFCDMPVVAFSPVQTAVGRVSP